MKVLLYLLVVQHGGGGVRVFHEGLFWRCSFTAASDQYSILDLWICERFTAMRLLKTHLVMQHHNSILPPPPADNPPPSKVCRVAFLFPFPASGSPEEPYELPSAIGRYRFREW